MESKDSGFYAFEADGWKALGFEACMLTEPMRQRDGSFVGMLNRARVADPSCLRYFNSLVGREGVPSKDSVRLFGTNRKADDVFPQPGHVLSRLLLFSASISLALGAQGG